MYRCCPQKSPREICAAWLSLVQQEQSKTLFKMVGSFRKEYIRAFAGQTCPLGVVPFNRQNGVGQLRMSICGVKVAHVVSAVRRIFTCGNCLLIIIPCSLPIFRVKRCIATH